MVYSWSVFQILVVSSTMQRTREVPSLKQQCVNVLIAFRRFIGDVGYVEPESLRSILSHCSLEELKHVEDETMAGSERDLKWYTWHIWQKLYLLEFPRPSEIIPLKNPPRDYVAPAGVSDLGNWRLMYYRAQKAKEDKLKQIADKLRQSYANEQNGKNSRKVETVAVTRIAAPMRPVGSLLSNRRGGTNEKLNMMRGLGLYKGGPMSLGPSRSQPAVTRSVEIVRTIPSETSSLPSSLKATPVKLNSAKSNHLRSTVTGKRPLQAAQADSRRGRPWPAAGSRQGTKIQAESLFSMLNPPGPPKRPIPVSIDKQSAGLLTSTKQRPEVGAKYSTAQAAKRLKR